MTAPGKTLRAHCLEERQKGRNKLQHTASSNSEGTSIYLMQGKTWSASALSTHNVSIYHAALDDRRIRDR